mgnify:CR=1 FL=1
MAIGLIKKEIIRSTGSGSAPLRKNKRQTALSDAMTNYESQLAKYGGQSFSNPYAKNVYSNMENKMEDLTVNQQQAQFQSQQNQQGQANILSSLQSGGGFNAGNIQALANQSQIGAQRASASIGQQESANQRLSAQQASKNQQLERKGRLQAQQGAANVQQMEMDRNATTLGMSMQQVGNAQEAISAQKAMMGQIIGGISQMAGSVVGGGLAGGLGPSGEVIGDLT